MNDGYIPIRPEHNAIKLILADLGKADLKPDEVEGLCHTFKCLTLKGFLRFDSLPCGCERSYEGKILGCQQTETVMSIGIGGLETVKPCAKHQELIEGIGGKR